MKIRTLVTITALFCLLVVGATTVSARDISIVTDDWTPYYGKNLKNQGFFSAIVKKAFKKSGHNAFISFIPWKRAETLAKKGSEDVLMGAYYLKEREEFFIFSEPIIEASMNLLVMKNSTITFDGDFSKLKKYKIGKVRGYVVSDAFSSAGLKVEEAATLAQNMKKLIAGRIDIVVDSPIVTKALMNKEFSQADREAIVSLSPPVVNNPLYLCFSRQIKDAKTVADKFNAALKEMKENGEIDAIKKEYGF